MTTQSNAVPQHPRDPQEIAPATISPTRPMYWSVRRELWENRSIYIAPLAGAAVYMLGFLISLFWLPRSLRGLEALHDATPQPIALAMPYSHAAMLIMIVGFPVGIFYSLDALHSERRERSILFWKSLPVSDTSTVLVKFLVGLALVPLGSFLLAAATSLLASPALLLRARLHLDTGVSLWSVAYWLRTEGLLLYALLATLLWYAPYAAYLMLASAWARHLPSAWACLPPLLLVLFEYLIFRTHYVAQALQRGPGELLQLSFRGGDAAGGLGSEILASTPDPLQLLGSAQLWLGLLTAAALLALAIRVRRYRDDS